MNNKIIFSEICNLIEREFYSFEYRNIEWDKLKLKYFRRLESDITQDVFEIVSELLTEIGDPHTKLSRKNEFISPVGIVLIDNKYYVGFNFLKDSKVEVGMELVDINNVRIEDYENKLRKKYKNISRNLIASKVIESITSSYKKEKFILKFLDNKKIEFNIEFYLYHIQDFITLCNEKNNLNEEKKINIEKIYDKTLYLNIPTFMEKNISERVIKSIKKNKNCSNLVIDIRNNLGGYIEETKKFTSLFINEDQVICYEETVNGVSELVVNKGTEFLTDKFKKIIILCNEFTGSSAEFIFIKALKGRYNNVIIIGSETIGLPHKAKEFTLFNNNKMYITTTLYKDNNNFILEKGIAPDFEVKNDLSLLYNKVDKQLMYALSICGGKSE
ncbi:MAG: S41 family peptidase [Clostridium sp.]